MNKLIRLFFIVNIITYFISCSDMNDKHDLYLQEGERIYIGKIDSLHVYPGNERVHFRFWMSDPRCKKVAFYWYPKNDTITVNLDKTVPTDSFDVYIGDIYDMKSITEGKYSLKIVAFDDHGNRSVPVEHLFNVYGDNYRMGLVNRPLKGVEYSKPDSTLNIEFSEFPISENEVGVNISYFDLQGKKNILSLTSDSLDVLATVSINNIDPYMDVAYLTKFLPDANALDTFSTDFTQIDVYDEVNIALHKPVNVSDQLSDIYPGSNAVDGKMDSNETRWVSNYSGEHWLEVDLEQEYNVSAIEVWHGSGGSSSGEIKEFMFQVEVDGEWVTVANETTNTKPNYYASFPEVKTSKVRYYIPAYRNNIVRLYEIAIYSKVKY